MNLSRFIVAPIIISITIFCTTLGASANDSTLRIEPQSTETAIALGVDGGPRTVIQFMTSVTVFQPEAVNLNVTVIDSNGAVRCNLTTDEVQTVISTEGWAAGDYTVQTVDDENVYQEFDITIN